MTKKERKVVLQKAENDVAIREFRKAKELYSLARARERIIWKKFRNCSAETCTIGKYIFLRSYNSIIAVADTEERAVYDVLRYVYGYTVTSNRHICKFAKELDYMKLTYRAV